MIKKSLGNRLARLEETFKTSDERELCNQCFNFILEYGIPSVEEFVDAIINKDRLETVKSTWVQGFVEKGGKEEFLKMLEMMETIKQGTE